MNYFLPQLEGIIEKEYIKGFHGKALQMQGFTMVYWRIEAGSELPEHAHVHEQVTNLMSGTFEMEVGGEKQLCQAGDVVAIPSNVVHSGRAITDCTIIDVFQPVRPDYQ